MTVGHNLSQIHRHFGTSGELCLSDSQASEVIHRECFLSTLSSQRGQSLCASTTGRKLLQRYGVIQAYSVGGQVLLEDGKSLRLLAEVGDDGARAADNLQV